MCIAIAYNLAIPVQEFFRNTVGLSSAVTLVAVAASMILLTAAIYGVIALFFNILFIRKERHQQRIIDAFSENINHLLNANDILQNLTDTILETTHLDTMMVFVRQIDNDFRVEHTTNPLDEKNFYIRADHPLVTYFKNKNEYVSIQDFSRATIYRSLWEKEKQLLNTINADYFIPLISEYDLVGIIVLPRRKDKAPYHTNDLNTVLTLSSIAATPLK